MKVILEVKNDPERGIYSVIVDRLKAGKEPAVAGAIIVIPMVITFVAITWLLGMVANIPGTRALELTPYFYVNQTIKLATLLAAGSILITGIGKIAGTRQGFRLEELVDGVFGRLPLVGVVYSTAKVTTDTILGGKTDFGRPVKIELEGMKLTGFKTGNKTGDGRNIIFIPTSPNVTSGFVVEIDDRWLQSTDETVSEAMTKVLSAGFGMKINTETDIAEKKSYSDNG